MKPIVTGLAGFGASARNFHAPFLTSLGGFTLKSVVERKSQDSAIKYPWITLCRDYEELLSDPEIELVIVSTPNATHYEFARMALEAGKHVVVEKPFTVTSTEGGELLALAMARKKALTVYHNRRLDGDFLTLKALLEGRRLGRLVEGEIRYERWSNALRKKAWKEEPLPGSTLLDDLGSHLIDQALCLFGPPEKLFCRTEVQRDGSRTPDAFVIHFYYPQFTVTLKAGMVVREPLAHFAFHGTAGSYVKKGLDPQEAQLAGGISPLAPGYGLDPEAQWGTLNTAHEGLHFLGRVETLPGNYGAFYHNLYEVIRNGTVPLVRPEDALSVIRLIEHCRRSHDEGKVLTVDWDQ